MQYNSILLYYYSFTREVRIRNIKINQSVIRGDGVEWKLRVRSSESIR